jgi:cellulose synthase/poly-beta-1,6-N-acetylglucosamine synthase-like glycosyltransferase
MNIKKIDIYIYICVYISSLIILILIFTLAQVNVSLHKLSFIFTLVLKKDERKKNVR